MARPAITRLNCAALLLTVVLALAGCSRDDGRVWLGGEETLQLTRAGAPAETYET